MLHRMTSSLSSLPTIPELKLPIPSTDNGAPPSFSSSSLTSSTIDVDDTKAKHCKICGINLVAPKHNPVICRHMVEIVPGLFIGGLFNVFNEYELTYCKIGALMSVAYGDHIKNRLPETSIPSDYRRYYEWEDRDRFNIKPSIDSILEQIHLWITRDHKAVLVNCFQGQSRSGAVIIGYLMKYHKLSTEEALMKAKLKKPDIKPNNGFIKQLKELYEPVLTSSSSLLSLSSSSSNNSDSLANKTSGSEPFDLRTHPELWTIYHQDWSVCAWKCHTCSQYNPSGAPCIFCGNPILKNLW